MHKFILLKLACCSPNHSSVRHHIETFIIIGDFSHHRTSSKVVTGSCPFPSYQLFHHPCGFECNGSALSVQDFARFFLRRKVLPDCWSCLKNNRAVIETKPGARLSWECNEWCVHRQPTGGVSTACSKQDTRNQKHVPYIRSRNFSRWRHFYTAKGRQVILASPCEQAKLTCAVH